jgi:hypothetical protein
LSLHIVTNIEQSVYTTDEWRNNAGVVPSWGLPAEYAG